jgi:hypothetical protein
MQVTFKLTVHETPIAGAPIMINATTATTDVNGEITTSLVTNENYTVSTGLDALSFLPLYDSGAGFGARSPVTIEAQRLITSLESPCRIVIGGLPNIYFTSVNSSDRTLTVPLDNPQLNSMLSVTGEAVPPESFAPGTNGFAIPESYFQRDGVLNGVWKFLGQDITVSSAPAICADRGVPGSCQLIDPVVLRDPFEHTRQTIIKLTNQSIAAARAGRWKGANGQFSVPFLTRGAKALAAMERSFKDSTLQNFVCEVTPQSCMTRRTPKKQMIAAFKKVFEGKVPRGLEHIVSRKKKEIAAFEKLIAALPDSYTTCE